MDLVSAKRYIIKRLESELSNNLFYHGIEHTISVCNAAIKLAESEGLSEKEKTIIHTAALYHDAGFLFQYENNEEKAVELIHEVLPVFNYHPSDIELIANIILSTKEKRRPINLLEKIMSDADYHYLGGREVKRIANNLFKELKAHGTRLDEDEWIQVQIKFLNKHRYFTKTAINLRRNNKLRYLHYLNKISPQNC